MGKWISNIPKETLDAFTSYSWPGNVRELQNLIERAVIGSDNGVLANPFTTLDPNPLGPHLTNARSAVVLGSAQGSRFRESQRTLILQALHAADWIVGGPRGAPARLGLKRTTLISKMKRLGISRPVGQVEVVGLSQHGEPDQLWQPTAYSVAPLTKNSQR
jgi:transcriptional regulator with GAF, ATPase, and Fis domain